MFHTALFIFDRSKPLFAVVGELFGLICLRTCGVVCPLPVRASFFLFLLFFLLAICASRYKKVERRSWHWISLCSGTIVLCLAGIDLRGGRRIAATTRRRRRHREYPIKNTNWNTNSHRANGKDSAEQPGFGAGDVPLHRPS